MDFKLNEYHRNISMDEIINDIKSVAKKLKKETLTSEYNIEATI